MALTVLKREKKMFSFLKKLMGGTVEAEAEIHPESAVAAPPAPPVVRSSPKAMPRSPSPPGQPGVNNAKLGLPLNAVLMLLSPEFQSRVNQSYAAEVDVSFPLEKVLPQLSRGSVKVSFGELRRAAPPGTFSEEEDLDQGLVELPLVEILSRLNPALLTRRPPQRKVEVPEEITGPFGPKGEGLVVAALKPKPSAQTPVSATRTVEPAREVRTSAAKVETPEAPAAIPASAAMRSLNLPIANTLQFAPVPVTVAVPVSVPTPEPVAAPTVAKETEYLMVALGKLINAWPEAVLQEITQLNYSGATLALPVDMLEKELKHGKVTLTWKLLRSMIRPAPATTSVSVHDSAALDLPLPVIAPLFLARQRTAKQQTTVALGEDIPDLFSGSTQRPLETPVAPAAPVAATIPIVPMATANPVASEFIPAQPATPRREEDTNYYIWKDDADSPDAAAPAPKAATEPGTSFLKKFATPNEVVRKATGIEGVVGSLIALADGLLVAKSLPPDMNGENLAAFLPQIFGRVSQSTRELKMGELNNLNFTVGNVPWKIFRVGGMFFAAYGRAGQPLPGAPLVTIVAELDRKSK